MNTILEALQDLNRRKTAITNEDFSDYNNLPVEPLPINEVKQYIIDIPEAIQGKPPTFFKLGYMKELGEEIAAKFRGGRGSGENSKIRIIKCTEYSKLYTGVPWLGTNATKKADKVLGTERHTGERTGFDFSADGGVENRIGRYQNGKEALQAYIADGSRQKVKFFISVDGGDLKEASREEVSKYLTPATANKVLGLNKKEVDPSSGPEVKDKMVNRFVLDNIYMIGNLGHSVM